MLTFHYVPYTMIESLTSAKRVNLLLGMVKTNDVILLEGKLKPKEEASLIKKTMEQVSKEFPGIEISTMKDTTANEDLMTRLKSQFFNALMGDRAGFTIIGPASIIREIKQDPDKIHLLLNGEEDKLGQEQPLANIPDQEESVIEEPSNEESNEETSADGEATTEDVQDPVAEDQDEETLSEENDETEQDSEQESEITDDEQHRTDEVTSEDDPSAEESSDEVSAEESSLPDNEEKNQARDSDSE
jgi:hypothetical protein